jgi:hypothetical protein
MTLEINWTVPANTAIPEGEGFPLDLELSEGRVIEAIAWGDGSVEEPVRRSEDGALRLGTQRSGRVRTRVETAPGGNLRFRAGGQLVHIPVSLVLEGPQRTPPQAPVDVEVKRLPWDLVSIALADGDGTVKPGTKLPMHVGINDLTP